METDKMYIEPVSLLKQLVKIDTTNPPGREKALLSLCQDILTEAGIPSVFQETAPERGNLLAWLSAGQEKVLPPLILLSHTDVVGADAGEWKHPPFLAEEEDGYIYGRGTVDTKQLTVMELAAFLSLKESGITRKRDVYFLATSDEESGSAFGLQYFLDHEITLDGKTITGRELFHESDVLSEGGGFPVCAGDKEYYLCESGQKSCGTVEFTFKARYAKGTFFGSGDAMVRAMTLVQELGSLSLEGKTLETVKNFETKLEAGSLSPMMKSILLAMKKNTITVTMIEGKSVNEVKVICDVRLIPGFGRSFLTELLDSLAEKTDSEYRILSLSEGYESDPHGAFLEALETSTLEVLGKDKSGAEILPFVSMGSSDGRLLAGTGARVYGYSPVYSWDMTFDSAVTMVHGVNERIHRDSVEFGSRVLTLAVRKAAGEE